MLGTTWGVFSADDNVFPSDTAHYVVYWVGSVVGALIASVMYALYSGESFFGKTLPVTPIKAKKD